MRAVVFVLMISAALGLPVRSDASEGFTVVEPLDGSSFEWELVTVVVRLRTEGVEGVLVRVGEGETRVPLSEGRRYICLTVTLEYGPNEIVVSTEAGGEVVESERLRVFYRSDVSKEYRVIPPGFRRRPFHLRSREDNCRGCHRMDVTETDLKPVRSVDSLCHRCHGRITAYSNVHGPAAKWDCLRCHDPASSPLRYETPKPDRDLCFRCHEEKRQQWKTRKYFHGPAATGKCSICHNPHGSENIFRLRKPIWDLCVSCHEEKGSGRHVLAGFVFGDAHPTRGRPDPVRYGRELVCSSCHDPHASNSRYLFANDVLSPGSLCRMCHRK